MDDMIEFVLEVVGEIFGEVLESAFSNPKTPRWLRVTVSFFVALLLSGIITLLICGVMTPENAVILRVLCGVGAAALVALCVFIIHRAIGRKQSEDEMS